MVKDGRRYNLGYHYYRVRRTTEPQGTLLQVGLPELREFGEARPLFVERNQTALTAGLYLTFGVAGGIVASILPSHFPENTDPFLYIADCLIGLGSIAGVVQGIRTIRQNRSTE